MNKKGFTLVELLAVIVILAIILVIAVPRVLDVIGESTTNSMISSVKLIASTAEKEYASSILTDNNEELTCNSISTINNIDYEDCTLTMVSGKAYVTVKGSGKFAGKYICNGTSKKAEITNVDCTDYATTKIIESGNMTLDDTSDSNPRYVGSNPNNYVTFNNETWRIIGIFNISNGTTTEPRIKLIRNESIGNYSFDNTTTESNYGTNDYSVSTLKGILNGLYLNSGSGQCKTEESGATVAGNNERACNFTSTGLNNNSLIDSVVWNIGGTTWSNPSDAPYGLPTLDTYNKERGASVYKKLTGTPNIIHNEIFTGKVGLPYPSDYGYASTDLGCRSNLRSGASMNGTSVVYTNTTCKNNNWLDTSGSYHYWTISPSSSYSNGAFYVSSGGCVHHYYAYYPYVGVRPVIYLKSNVKITSGDGRSGENKYVLSA